MFLSEKSIQQCRDASIVQVVGKYAELKKHGANYTACCPFHDEKTPSFSVNEVKGIYKCFGCGASGDVIKFVSEFDKLDFIEACKKIGDLTGLHLEFEEREFTEAQKEKFTAAQAQQKVLETIVPIYTKALLQLEESHPAKEWLRVRKFDDDTIVKWQIGWAGTDWHFVTPTLVTMNLFDAAYKLNVIKRSADDRNYDGYRSRITFPICDQSGRFIGLGGRYIQTDDKDPSQIPKYINSPECELYNKSTVLYGINHAVKAITKQGFARVTEGYTDVIGPSRIGFENTVATCGTAFTADQMKLLKKYTSHVIMMRDNDQAGTISFNSQLPALLKAGFKVDIADYEEKDPEEWSRNQVDDKPAKIDTADGIMHRVEELWCDADGDIHKKVKAKEQIFEILSCISNSILRNHYFDQCAKEFKWKGPQARKEFADILESNSDENVDEEESGVTKFPRWVDEDQKEAFLRQGYLSINRKGKDGGPMVGYYTFSGSGKTEITNFIVKPLFHVYAGIDSRFLLQIYNGDRSAVLDIPSRIITSIEQFQGYTVSEGAYMIFGSKNQWLRIASELLKSFPRCIEINSLGWQHFGFYAWVDKIFIPGEGLKDLNEWGIIKQKIPGEDTEENFLIPASCSAYKQLQKTGNDPYENDRFLRFIENKVTFSDWAAQMQTVFGQKGIVAVAYSILTLFRDIVFAVDNNCPHLYGFGEPSSGKSKWAESLCAIFYHKRPAFNLNSGTDFAFFSYMQRYCNAPSHLNEFDIEVIKMEWFQAIKGIYDGEGRERGKAGSRNRTEIMRVHSPLVLTGQKLVTHDDNSVVTRSIIESFSTVDYTEEEKHNYNVLKQWESKGLSNILVEVLQYRKEVQALYQDNVNNVLSYWRKTNKTSSQLNQRIMLNFAHLVSGYELISKYIKLPQSVDDFKDYCFRQSVRWSQFIRSSDTLSEFWRTLEFLVNQQEVFDGWDFLIEEHHGIKVRKNRTEEVDIAFEKPTKILFIRLNNIHKLFETAYRQRTGKVAMNLENLLHYFTSRKYYLGPVKSKTWKKFETKTENITVTSGLNTYQRPESQKKELIQKSSAYAFIYEDLEIEIERSYNDGNGEEEDDIPTPSDAPFPISKNQFGNA